MHKSVHQMNLVDHNIEGDHWEELSELELHSIVGGGQSLYDGSDEEIEEWDRNWTKVEIGGFVVILDERNPLQPKPNETLLDFIARGVTSTYTSAFPRNVYLGVGPT